MFVSAQAPGSPLVLITLAPLTRALAQTRRATQSGGVSSDLANRLASVLRILSASGASAPPPGSRPAAAAVTAPPLPMTVEELTSGLRKTLYVASRERDRPAAQAAAAAWAALIRGASVVAEPEGEAVVRHQNALPSWFLRDVALNSPITT